MEVDRDAEPISGVLRRDGTELTFDGWVGLAGALERILEAPAQSSDDNTTPRGGN